MIDTSLETAEAMSRALRAGDITAAALLSRSLERIRKNNGRLNAFVLVDTAGATTAALEADVELAAGVDRGPLHGVPIAVKDIFDVRGLPTGCGTAADFGIPRAHADADVVKALREAGAVIVGKTTMHEFAYGATGDRSAQGPSRNPVDPARMSGGSSGGSAVAVASGMVPLALGTDTAGSVRVPAALCGVVGLKPTLDELSTDGVFPLAPSLDHVGLFARTPRDARALYRALRPRVDESAAPASANGVAWVSPEVFVRTDPRVTATAYNAVAGSGLHIRECDALDGLQLRSELFALFSTIQSHEAYRVHANHLETDAHLIDAEVLARLRAGEQVSAAAYDSAIAGRARFCDLVDRLLGEADVIALPTVPVAAPLIGERALQVAGEALEVRATLLALTSPWNLAGVPALSVPAGTVDDLPVGVQLVTRPGKEDLLFDVARAITAPTEG